MSVASETTTAGRTCPLHYRYGPGALAVAAEASCETLYVVGGLYGNEAALDTVVALFESEPGRTRLVFNGDFHWFDIDPRVFARIDERIAAFTATRGNVETEFAGDDGSAGCGCGYPDSVDSETVERSNRILERLRRACPSAARRERLGELPMWRRIDVGRQRVAIVHGDAESLAGWGFAHERLVEPTHRRMLAPFFDLAGVDIFASSHTCLPALARWNASDGSDRGVVVNNGAAGMPNVRGTRHGLVTRISTSPFTGPQRRHGTTIGGIHVDALAIDYGHNRFAAQFLADWPVGSDAHASYWRRIVDGKAMAAGDALIST